MFHYKYLSEMNKLLIFISLFFGIVPLCVSLFAQNYSSIMTSLIGLSIIILILVFNHKIKRRISITLECLLIFFVFTSISIRTIMNPYVMIPHYDKGLHLFSGILASWFFVEVISNNLKNINFKLKLLFLNCFNASIALLWEIIEFSFDYLFNQTSQKGLIDTMMDMILGVLGGLIVSAIYSKKRLILVVGHNYLMYEKSG